MVSKTISYISKIWGIISGGFLILIALFPNEVRNLIVSTLGVSNEEFVFYAIIGLLLFGIISSIIIFIYERFKKHNKIKDIESDVEKIDGVHAHIFFPNGTITENQTLEYHITLTYRKKLIVNHKVDPPKAYYVPAHPDSYGWQLIKKYSIWVSEFESYTNLKRDDFTKKWCDKKGYTLIPLTATKKDLLEKK